MKHHIEFLKYQGCGNDFIIKDELTGRTTPDAERSRLAKSMTNRHFSVGADGVIFVERAKGVDGSMRLFEPAGNEADMCGNGIRCLADYLSKKLGKNEVSILTKDGVKRIARVGDGYRVDMGSVRTTRAALSKYVSDKGSPGDSMMDASIRAGRRYLRGSLVNSGEPHLVFRSRRLSAERVRLLGDAVNGDKRRFPKGVNLNFVRVVGAREIAIRTYERGVYDETLACGTGATASAAVALMKGWLKPGPVRVRTRGGNLTIEILEDGRAFMTGPARFEFSGSAEVTV